jgi:tetratricopeptide (TPR) repeat protein
LGAARAHFERYSELARQLVAIDPANKAWQLEAGYAASNLGTFALKGEMRPDQARTLFERSIVHFESARHLAPGDAGVLRDLADAYAWHADSLRDSGRVEQALAERLKERAIYEQLAAADPKNAKLALDLAGSSVGIARLETMLGQRVAAIGHLREARAALDELARKDPENRKVARQQASVWLRLAEAVRGEPGLAPGDRSLIEQVLRRCATDPDMREGERLERCEELRGQK